MFKQNSIAFFVILFCFLLPACLPNEKKTATETVTDSMEFTIPDSLPDYTLVVLGTIQDGGSPHINCKKTCCRDLFTHPALDRKVVALGILDKKEGKSFLFEAGPDIAFQLKMLRKFSGNTHNELPSGIFLTHAHIGHYSGLMYLGKEAASSNSVPVYAMPRMKSFLENNGPWSQLVSENNISITPLAHLIPVQISSSLSVTPILVPHRDEFSETVGFIMKGPRRSVLFIPDIDKWSKWEKDIIELVKQVDYAFIDATFYSGDEIKQRDLSKIPHPFVIETMEIFKSQNAETKNKIHFIHLNHSNPLLQDSSRARKQILVEGYHIAAFGSYLAL